MTSRYTKIAINFNEDFNAEQELQEVIESSKFSEKKLIALKKFEDLGLFRPFENSVYSFSLTSSDHVNTEESERTHLAILFRRKYDMNHPYLSYNMVNDLVMSPNIASLNNLNMNDFTQKIKERFSQYSLPLVNGFSPMQYLDFVTNWSYTWDEKTMHIVDELVTAKIALNKIWFLLEKNVPSFAWKESLELPESWVEKIYEKRI